MVLQVRLLIFFRSGWVKPRNAKSLSGEKPKPKMSAGGQSPEMFAFALRAAPRKVLDKPKMGTRQVL